MTSFVGRRLETEKVKLALSGSRLVTLTGVGGVGKSRLAMYVASKLRRAFPDGVYLVELADVQDPALVPSAVLTTFGLLERAERDAEAMLASVLAGKRVLIVLDNCEHLLDAAGRLVHRLLSTVPGLRVLATSREPLGIDAEHVRTVSSLSVPPTNDVSPDQARRFEAVRLFEDRAAAVLPGFSLGPDNTEAVIKLCRQLDGLPLALELAAVPMSSLSVEQILSRLTRRFELLTKSNRSVLPRHQTLRAAVDWSYELCTEQERKLWARCSVFAGEFDLEAAEYVCASDGLTEGEIFTGIAGLVDKSVLAREDHGSLVRYRMLETLRQYGAGRLAEAGERDRIRRRHRDFYLRLAEQSDADSRGPWQPEWIRRLRAERANLSAALEYCLTVPGDARAGMRLAAALWFYWVVSGAVRDGRYWLDRALAANAEASRERAMLLWMTGWMAFLQGDKEESLRLLTEGRDLARNLGEETVFTHASQFLGAAEISAHNFERGVPVLEEALIRHRNSGNWTVPGLLIFGQLARAAVLANRIDDALALVDECRAICSDLGERWALSWTEWNLAVLWWEMGQYRQAAAGLRRALRHKAVLDDRLGILFCVELLAWVAVTEGDPRRAAVLFGASGELWQVTTHAPLFGFRALLQQRTQALERAREALGERTYRAAAQRGARMSLADVVTFALGEHANSDADSAKEERASQHLLTRREQQVAELVAAGKSNREIADELVISQRTVESHVDHILSKLGFSSRTQVAVWLATDKSR